MWASFISNVWVSRPKIKLFKFKYLKIIEDYREFFFVVVVVYVGHIYYYLPH